VLLPLLHPASLPRQTLSMLLAARRRLLRRCLTYPTRPASPHTQRSS
jgi:hypothetical protein